MFFKRFHGIDFLFELKVSVYSDLRELPSRIKPGADATCRVHAAIGINGAIHLAHRADTLKVLDERIEPGRT